MSKPAGGTHPTANRTGFRRSGLGSRPVWWGAFGLSAAMHVLFIVVYPLFGKQIRPDGAAFPLPSSSARPEGIEVIHLVEIDALPDAVRPQEPVQMAHVEAATPELAGPVTGPQPLTPEPPGFGESAADRLRTDLKDARLWAPMPPEFTELTLEEREELAVAGRLTEWNDSVAAAVASATPNWAFTDSKGGKWGVADGKLHLGSISIPLPFSFDAAPGADRDYLRSFDEMARQSANAQTQQTVRERMEAIRARRDKEHAAAQADSAKAPN
jgi:hypothetical protein